MVQSSSVSLSSTDLGSSTDGPNSSNSISRESMKINGAFAWLNISNGKLSWVDVKVSKGYLVQNLTIKTRPIKQDVAFVLQM